MNFIWPWLLLSLLLVPLLIWLYGRQLRTRRQAQAALGPLGLVQDQAGRSDRRRRHIAPALFLCGLTLLLVALARPRVMVTLPRIEGTVILAFDISQSMMADDLLPTRIDAAKEAARIFVENQPSTIQIGVVAFSNGGLIVQAPTHDQAAVLSTIKRLSPQGGTSLGQGIYTALNAVVDEPIVVDEDLLTSDRPVVRETLGSAVVILLTDGENTGPPDPLEVAQVAAETGIRIYPVGIGTEAGTVLEIDGFQVVSRLDEAMLQNIAGLTNGTYYRAEDETALQDVYDSIDLQLAIDGELLEVTAVLAGISLIFFLIGGALSLLWYGRIP